jgi:hypothetical protein
MTHVNKWCLAPFIQDGGALVTFAVIGMLSHDGSVFVAGFVRDAVPLLIGWFAVAAAVGTYRRPSRSKLLLTWAIGIPLGVVIRGIALGRHVDGMQAAFLVTTMVFTLVLVLAFRAAGTRIAARG